MTKNIRIMLALFIIAGLYVFVFGCDDVTVSVEGKVEDWTVTGVDDAIEDAAEPLLDFGDDAVEAARDTIKDVVEWGAETDEDLSDIWGVGW